MLSSPSREFGKLVVTGIQLLQVSQLGEGSREGCQLIPARGRHTHIELQDNDDI